MALRVESNEIIDRAWDHVSKGLAQVVATSAINVEANTKANIRAHNLIYTGFMINSVQARKITLFTWEVVIGAAYSIYHELGTVYLPAKPSLGPALTRENPSFVMAIKVVMDRIPTL